MPHHYYRENKYLPYTCDITNKQCDFPSNLGLRVCRLCPHYYEWKAKKAFRR